MDFHITGVHNLPSHHARTWAGSSLLRMQFHSLHPWLRNADYLFSSLLHLLPANLFDDPFQLDTCSSVVGCPFSSLSLYEEFTGYWNRQEGLYSHNN